MTSTFFKRGDRLEYVKPGAKCRHVHADRTVETASVLGVYADGFGIPHVRYKVVINGPMSKAMRTVRALSRYGPSSSISRSAREPPEGAFRYFRLSPGCAITGASVVPGAPSVSEMPIPPCLASKVRFSAPGAARSGAHR
jgi:hypothetical protein